MATEDTNKEQELEVSVGESDALEIDVVDDTPEADKGKEPIGTVETPSDAELSNYAEDVQKRIKKLSRGYHDERREKEKAARERDEAIAFARRQYEFTKQLQEQLSTGSQQLVDTTKSEADYALEAAKRKFKEAYDAGDAEKIAAAQEEIATASYKKEQAKALKPLQFKETEVYNQPHENTTQTTVATPSGKALAWQEENTWFGEDDEMTSFALGLHQKLVKSGVDPESDEYYEKVDTRIRQVFPEHFGSKESNPASTNSTPRAKTSSVVAPATRSSAPKRITLTATQVQLARKLGLTNEQYAHEVVRLQGAK